MEQEAFCFGNVWKEIEVDEYIILVLRMENRLYLCSLRWTDGSTFSRHRGSH